MAKDDRQQLPEGHRDFQADPQPVSDNFHPAELEKLDKAALLKLATDIGLHVNPDGDEEQLRGELREELIRRNYPDQEHLSP